MTQYIEITQKEFAQLIDQCKQPIAAVFGPGGVALKWKDATPMPEAVERLGLMRGVLNENMDGAGI